MVDWALKITDGRIYMHQFGIIHCDLKFRNILIDIPISSIEDIKNATLKLVNVSFLDTSAMPSHGTSHKLPSQVMKNYICRKSDVWSFGVTLWEIIHKTMSYQGLEGLQILYKIGFKRETLDIKDNCNPNLAAIMNFGQIRDELLKTKNKIGNCKTI